MKKKKVMRFDTLKYRYSLCESVNRGEEFRTKSHRVSFKIVGGLAFWNSRGYLWSVSTIRAGVCEPISGHSHALCSPQSSTSFTILARVFDPFGIASNNLM